MASDHLFYPRVLSQSPDQHRSGTGKGKDNRAFHTARRMVEACQTSARHYLEKTQEQDKTHCIFPETPSRSQTSLTDTHRSFSTNLPNHFQNLHALLESVNSCDDFYTLAILWQLLAITFMGITRNRGGGGIFALMQGHRHYTLCFQRQHLPDVLNWHSRDEKGTAVCCFPMEVTVPVRLYPGSINCFKSHSALWDKTDFSLGYQPMVFFFF